MADQIFFLVTTANTNHIAFVGTISPFTGCVVAIATKNIAAYLDLRRHYQAVSLYILHSYRESPEVWAQHLENTHAQTPDIHYSITYISRTELAILYPSLLAAWPVYG